MLLSNGGITVNVNNKSDIEKFRQNGFKEVKEVKETEETNPKGKNPKK